MNKHVTVAGVLLALIAGPVLAQEDDDRAGDNRSGSISAAVSGTSRRP